MTHTDEEIKKLRDQRAIVHRALAELPEGDEQAEARTKLLAELVPLDEAMRVARTAQAAAVRTADDLSLKADLARLKAHADAALVRLALLPCNEHREAGEAARDVGDTAGAEAAAIAGATMCQAGRHFDGCASSGAPWCPRKLGEQVFVDVDKRLRAGRVPAKQAKLVRDHFRREGRAPLVEVDPDTGPIDAYRVGRAWLSRRPQHVATQAGGVRLRGNETVLVFYGPTGRGKTVTAAYLIARLGGLYLTAYELPHVGPDPNLPTKAALCSAELLVIDQAGREHSPSGSGATNMEQVIDYRYAQELPTVILGNFGQPSDFETAYDEIIADRLREVGVYVNCVGTSLRRRAQ